MLLLRQLCLTRVWTTSSRRVWTTFLSRAGRKLLGTVGQKLLDSYGLRRRVLWVFSNPLIRIMMRTMRTRRNLVRIITLRGANHRVRMKLFQGNRKARMFPSCVHAARRSSMRCFPVEATLSKNKILVRMVAMNLRDSELSLFLSTVHYEQ